MIAPIYVILSGNPAVVALAGTRIFQLRRGQQTSVQGDLPCVTFRLIAGTPENYQGEAPGIDQTRTQIDCWAADVDAARQLAQASVNALHSEGEILYNGDTYDEKTRISRWSFDFRFWDLRNILYDILTSPDGIPITAPDGSTITVKVNR